MLVNLTPNIEEIERRKQIAIENSFNFIPQSDPSLLQETGIYQSNFGFNFSYEEFLEFKDHSDSLLFDQARQYSESNNWTKSPYGVADTIEQIKKYYDDEIEDTNKKYIIHCTPVYQDIENKGKGGGWRWHKWGPYIGQLDTKCEYLDDEEFGPDFEYVICFKIIEIIENLKTN